MYCWRMEIATHGQVLTRFGHALPDPTRSQVLLALREAPAHPADLAEAIGVSRQAMSTHLTCLRGCGLVVAVPEGRRVRYELADGHLAHALSDLLDVVLAWTPTPAPRRQPGRTAADEPARAGPLPGAAGDPDPPGP